MNIMHDKDKSNPKIGLATIVIKDGFILVGYDGEKKKYSFPGGHWEGEVNKESFEEGAARELFEETGGLSGILGNGVKCKNFRKLYDHTFFRESNESWYRSVGFAADYESGNAVDDPTEQRTNWRFMDPKEALALDLFEPARRGLEIFLGKQEIS